MKTDGHVACWGFKDYGETNTSGVANDTGGRVAGVKVRHHAAG